MSRKTPHFLLVAKQAHYLRANLNSMDWTAFTDDQLLLMAYELQELRPYLDELDAHVAMRARIEKLGNVEGRTPEEAEAFKRKAAELRKKHL